MQIDLSALSPREVGKLLAAVVVPRPIALTTTVDRQGRVNAAPFSYFNVMGAEPPVVALGTGRTKDTAVNIAATSEFVVNLVPESLARAMNVTAVEFPPEVDELAAARLTPVASLAVAPPRIAESPVSLECRLLQAVELPGTVIQIGQVLHLHIRDEFYDPARNYVAADRLGLIGRMHGGGWYARTTDLFDMPRIPLSEWDGMLPKRPDAD